jgi:tRNA dimethylallyltransferase
MEALRSEGVAATRQLAKRQLTWLRSMTDVAVFDTPQPDLGARVLEHVRRELKSPGGS